MCHQKSYFSHKHQINHIKSTYKEIKMVSINHYLMRDKLKHNTKRRQQHSSADTHFLKYSSQVYELFFECGHILQHRVPQRFIHQEIFRRRVHELRLQILLLSLLQVLAKRCPCGRSTVHAV
jgi:hypothetical protein